MKTKILRMPYSPRLPDAAKIKRPDRSRLRFSLTEGQVRALLAAAAACEEAPEELDLQAVRRAADSLSRQLEKQKA